MKIYESASWPLGVQDEGKESKEGRLTVTLL